MKKIIFAIAVIIIVIIGCKTNSISADTKSLNLVFESKSNSKVTGTAAFTEKQGSGDGYLRKRIFRNGNGSIGQTSVHICGRNGISAVG